MPGELLIDTNIAIDVLTNRARAVSRVHVGDSLFLSSISLGELMYGVELSTHKQANRERLERLRNEWMVIPCDAGTAEFYASIRAGLKRAGRPIPDNDIWIAATAMQHDLTLVTRDAHFNHVERLKVESWS